MKAFMRRFSGGFFMFMESVSMSINNIVKNRMRSFLTILGIMIGVTAVIALVTTISGVSSSISDSFTSMGAGTMTVSTPGNDLKAGLSAKDMADLSNIDHVLGVTPSVSTSGTVARGSVYESSISIAGKNDFYFKNDDTLLSRGRAINILDIDATGLVCLINQDIIDSFFYGVDPIGETLYISGITFTVIGILTDAESSSIAGMMSGSSDIIVPYTTALKMNSSSLVTSITVYIDDANNADQVVSEMETMLDALFSFEDDTYTVTTMDSIESTMDEMLSMMSMLLGGIASIALLVGGIGIMNMMLTSVTERTMEIGLKKAIGAEPGQIQIQFLIESFLLSMVGGISGVILGIVLSAILCSVMGTQFTISYGAIALGVGFSAAVGIILGWSPARKASKLSPIDALRRM